MGAQVLYGVIRYRVAPHTRVTPTNHLSLSYWAVTVDTYMSILHKFCLYPSWAVRYNSTFSLASSRRLFFFFCLFILDFISTDDAGLARQNKCANLSAESGLSFFFFFVIDEGRLHDEWIAKWRSVCHKRAATLNYLLNKRNKACINRRTILDKRNTCTHFVFFSVES